jgi:hypothetical protein
MQTHAVLVIACCSDLVGIKNSVFRRQNSLEKDFVCIIIDVIKTKKNEKRKSLILTDGVNT